MVDGATLIVRETMDEVIAQITEFRARVLAAAADPTRSAAPVEVPAPATTAAPKYGELR
jgi:flagellar protein FlbD